MTTRQVLWTVLVILLIMALTAIPGVWPDLAWGGYGRAGLGLAVIVVLLCLAVWRD